MPTQTQPYDIQLDKVTSGFDGVKFWTHARAGVIPGDPPHIVVTTHDCTVEGSDYFGTINTYHSNDFGHTWAGPVAHEDAFGPRTEPGGWSVRFCDMMPQFHHASGKLLLTGHTARYLDQPHPPADRARETVWSVYDPVAGKWSRWGELHVPNEPRLEAQGPGSAQRFDLEDGTILLPIYGKPRSDDKKASHYAAVLRCAFDGQNLRYLEHGNILSVPDPRGCCEPSLTRFNGRFYLTIRNDVRGYVAVSDDGLHFDTPQPWTFDDGSELGNYNTQQHWVTHSDALYLVYTRKGLDNDNVFRHRAPLVMAQVDPDHLCVLRDTEREVVPNRGARLGNFGVTDISPEETWVVAAEWMQPKGCEQYGSDNTIWIARIKWNERNAMV